MTTQASAEAAPLLDLSDLWKSFGGAAALAGATLRIRRGEVHGLLGANGSGKSTLIKVLAGYHTPERGVLRFAGQPVELPLKSGQAEALGLRFVHQDLALVPSLSALENFMLSELAVSRGRWRVGWRAAARRMSDVMSSYQVEIDPRTLAAELRPVDRALLAIVRAMEGTRGAGRGVRTDQPDVNRLLVLDEPTVFLPAGEVARLFELVRNVTRTGASVLFVSHDLDEVREITDRVTVLRNGSVAITGETEALTPSDLVAAIVGVDVDLATRYKGGAEPDGPIAVEFRDLHAGVAQQVEFEVRGNEVLGLTGLLGSGYDDVVRALAGAAPAQGALQLAGVEYPLAAWTPRRAVQQGVAFVPGDRLRDGIIADLAVTENLAMVQLPEFLVGPALDHRKMRLHAQTLLDHYDVRPRDPKLLTGQLSGGNQQKVVIAKWMQTEPRLLLLDEPTQGVDVGARQQILATIRVAAEQRPVICASSDHEQLAQLCDRVLVMRRGQIVAELSGSDLTKSRITEATLRVSDVRSPL